MMQTFNDDQIDEKARAVYMKALGKIDEALDSATSTERLHALGIVASAACEGIIPEDGEEDEI